MKHARPDYDRIQDPAGLIPEDEPVFLLRGQDILAEGTVRGYGCLLRDSGGDPAMVQMCFDQADAMKRWLATRARHFPDLPENPHHANPSKAQDA